MSEEGETMDLTLEKMELDEGAPKVLRGRRTAVSAEPTSIEDLKSKRAPSVEKSAEEYASIKKLLKTNFLFGHLDEDSLQGIANVVTKKVFQSNDIIIKQGDSGDFFYILDSGECEIFVDDDLKKTCVPGDSFGELALMYNSPRAATVKASSDTVMCWALDRNTFKLTLMDSTTKKRQMYEAFLEDIPILSSLDKYERSTIADALKPKIFSKGETIIKQGDPGEEFFIIERGTCDIVIDSASQGEIESGGYFGELALLHDQPRAASIVASSESVLVLSINRQTFVGVMGPLHAVLKRNEALYQQFKNHIEAA